MCHQSLLWLFSVLGFCARALLARECAPCALRSCPVVSALECGSARVLARDPCGCCEQCSRLELELCGGPDWTLGSCGSGLTCAALSGTGPARAPEAGVCRVVPDAMDASDEDESCPLVSGCESVDGQCVCESKHSCIETYSFPNRDACVHAGKTGSHRHDHRHKFVGPVNPACVFSGCNLTADGCVCSSQSCDDHFTYANRSQCQRAAVSPRCVHDRKEFTEGEVYRMDPCWLCQCRGGVSFCSKAECAEVDCENFYVPEGECCPVCIDVELLAVESTKASCWVDHRLRAHEEQWKEDDCTFCQCVDGEPHCTAMACKQSCQNPVKIPGECCPFCEEPSYESVSPLLCPPLENCSLSGHDCPSGFQQDTSGCLLCRCVNNETCPVVSKHCSLECPMGYEKDRYGCEVCECSVASPKCRPMTCSKTCPYGYMRNKHGCEMCRCIRCPPFTCDKHCSEGFRKSRKGCSVCQCRDADRRVSSTSVSSSFCLTASGQRFQEGDGWHDGCRDCFCHAGREMCVLIPCPVPTCAHPVLRDHQCCPGCDEITSSSAPVMLWTSVTEDWISAAPPLHSVTPGDVFSRDDPSQTEMALIYQSAAWILAGILLAVVILLVAILVTCRKSWVQMSCYGAPKKTVILQKHQNKSSVVYMEPSRESLFQSISLSNGHVQR